ncbi:hypothetical protein [Hymenobacter sp. UYP22]|uniref:hypothetical protein n=1 Tax=Hymenobacter sp. UYP22 TaxID=3156348 RepID=UPI003395C6D8
MHLPEFSEAQMDLRFLAEAARLLEIGAVSTYRKLAEQLQQQPAIFREIEKGRYHCNAKLLYQLARCHAQADVEWVLFGQARTGRPEPTAAPKRERGRPVRER